MLIFEYVIVKSMILVGSNITKTTFLPTEGLRVSPMLRLYISVKFVQIEYRK